MKKEIKLEEYKKSWRKRREKEREKLERRCEKAGKYARECGKLLREKYGVRSVYLIGSAASPGRFHGRSDIDLLVRGLPDEKYFKALKDCWDLLTSGFQLDLIPWGDAPERLKEKAEERGELV